MGDEAAASRRKKKRKKAVAAKEKKPKVIKPPKPVEKSERMAQREAEYAEKGWNTGHWNEEEEKLFVEGLEKFGRDWKKVQEHLQNKRSIPNIRSHTQKHFIILYKQGKALPEACNSTGGPGHTLSGAPLNPKSAAAAR